MINFRPWPFSLVCPCTMVVGKGGKVMGLVVLTMWFCVCWA